MRRMRQLGAARGVEPRIVRLDHKQNCDEIEITDLVSGDPAARLLTSLVVKFHLNRTNSESTRCV
jgi:hypothetical protein